MKKKGNFFLRIFCLCGAFDTPPLYPATEDSKAENLIKRVLNGNEAGAQSTAVPAPFSRQDFILIVFAVVGVYQFVLNFHIDLLAG